MNANSVSEPSKLLFQGFRQSNYWKKRFADENEDFANSIVTGDSVKVTEEIASYSKVSIFDGNTVIKHSNKYGMTAGAGIKDLFNISVSMKSTEEINVSDSTIIVVIDVMRYLETIKATNSQWKSDAQLPTDPGQHDKLKNFYQYYGDSFVSSVSLGGRFMAVYAIHTLNSSYANDLQREISADGNVKGIDLKGQVESKIKDELKKAEENIELMILSTGLNNIGLQLPSVNSSVDQVFQFAAQLRNEGTLPNPAILERLAAGYEKVPGNPGFTTAFETVRQNRDSLFSPDGGFNTRFSYLSGVRFALKRIGAYYRLFGKYEDPAVGSTIALVEQDLTTLKTLYDQYEQNPGAPLSLETEWKASDKLNPEMVVDIVDHSIGLGKEDGPTFRLPILDNWKEAPIRIQVIQVDTRDGFVGNIKLCYERPLYTLAERFQHIPLGWVSLRVESVEEESAVTQAGGIGVEVLKSGLNPFGLFDREYDQLQDKIREAGTSVKKHFVEGPKKEFPTHDTYITKISGFSGDYVDKLDIQLSQGGQNLVAGRLELDNSFHWDVPKGQCVIGFSGRAVHMPLGALHPVRVVFSPTKMEAL